MLTSQISFVKDPSTFHPVLLEEHWFLLTCWFDGFWCKQKAIKVWISVCYPGGQFYFLKGKKCSEWRSVLDEKHRWHYERREHFFFCQAHCPVMSRLMSLSCLSVSHASFRSAGAMRFCDKNLLTKESTVKACKRWCVMTYRDANQPVQGSFTVKCSAYPAWNVFLTFFIRLCCRFS